MICVFVILLAICCKAGIAHACVVIQNCHESSNTNWKDGIFCHSVFSKTGSLLWVNCSWLPYPLLSSSEYKQQLVWWNNIHSNCVELDASETSKTISKYKFYKPDDINKIWVSVQISNKECVKTNNFIIKPKVNCQAPLIQYAAQSSNLLRFQLDRTGQLRYKETAAKQWHTVNVTGLSTTIPVLNTSQSFVAQQRCFSESCFHCRWTQEKSIQRELTGSPDITVITETISPGKQRVSIELKYVMHAYVDEYNVKIQRIPNSCESDITFNTKSTKFHVNLSIAFFNVTVTACNGAGNSSIASALVRPLTSPELPGKIFATYEYDNIFLTWSPLFINDFSVINWGTDYTQMKDVILMDPIHNYSIPGPFESLKRYTITIYLHENNMCMDSRNETTFGITYIYKEEGVPRTGAPNVTLRNVSKTSAVIEWEDIPEEDCLGFLLFYRIFYTDIIRNITKEISVNSSSKRSFRIEELTSSHQYHVTVSGVTIKGTGPPSAALIFTTLQYAESEFQIIIIPICVGLMIIAVIVVSVCAYILNRTKNWYFPKIPNPEHSYLSKINEDPDTKNKLVQLLQTEEVSCENMDVEVIEKVPITSTPMDSTAEDIELNVPSDYQNQWCPSAEVLQAHDNMSVPQTAQHINEEGSEATQLPAL